MGVAYDAFVAPTARPAPVAAPKGASAAAGSASEGREFSGPIFYRVLLGLHWDNGKENGNYYIIIGFRV